MHQTRQIEVKSGKGEADGEASPRKIWQSFMEKCGDGERWFKERITVLRLIALQIFVQINKYS